LFPQFVVHSVGIKLILFNQEIQMNKIILFLLLAFSTTVFAEDREIVVTQEQADAGYTLSKAPTHDEKMAALSVWGGYITGAFVGSYYTAKAVAVPFTTTTGVTGLAVPMTPVVLGTFGGAIIGAVTGYYGHKAYVTARDDGMFDDLKDKARDAKDYMKDKAEDAKDYMSEKKDKLKDKTRTALLSLAKRME
jgi:Na+/glutamate symporter